MATEGLPRSCRIRRARDFAAMRTAGRAIHTANLKVVVRASEHSRLGLVVSKKVSKRAVDRNRVKRRLREVYRRNAKLFPENADVLLIAKPSARDIAVCQLVEQLTSARLTARRGGRRR